MENDSLSVRTIWRSDTFQPPRLLRVNCCSSEPPGAITLVKTGYSVPR